MAASKVEIANSALIKIGAAPILSFDDATKEARLVKHRYIPGLRACLRSHIWNFALKRLSLAPTATTPAFKYTYEFALPADFVRALDVSDGDQDYRMENGKILANTNELEFLYVYQNEETPTYDALFDEVLANYLAWDLSYALTQSMSVKRDCWEAYRESLRQARSVNAKEEIHEAMDAEYWDLARLSSSTSRANR